MGNKNIRIENIKMNQVGVFKTLDLDFPIIDNDDKKAEIHIFTGANGIGKTTLLEGLTSSFNANSVYAKISRETKNASISLKLNNDLIVKWPNKTKAVFKDFSLETKYTKEADFKHWEYIKNNNRFSGNYLMPFDDFSLEYAVFGYSGYRKLTTVDFREKEEKNHFFPLYMAIQFDKNIFNFNIFSEWALNILNKHAHALKNNNTELAKSTRKTLTLIENIISDFTKFSFEFDVEYETNVKLIAKLDKKTIDINHLPSGLISIFTWLGDLLHRLDGINWENKSISITEQNFILFLDEIEVHLHPKWQRKVLPLVQKLFPNAQIFVSTHSPFVVNSVSDAWVYKLDLDEEGYSFVSKTEKTSPAKSTSLILNEIFDVEENFGEEVQRELEEFYNLRNQLMHSDNGKNIENKLIEKHNILLSYNNIELSNIIGFEMRQLSRMTNKDFSL